MLHTLPEKANDRGVVAEAPRRTPDAILPARRGPIALAALTIVRMIDILDDWRRHRPAADVAFINTLSRAIARKEEHEES